MIQLSHISSNSSSKVTLNKVDTKSASIAKKKPSKTTHVPTACINCKKAHLACDLSRPCKRCTALDKCDTCIDIKHKKRGRPKLTAAKKMQSINDKLINNGAPTPVPTTTTATTTNTRNNFSSLLPMAAPGLSACSFDLTSKSSKSDNVEKSTVDQLASKSEMMTIFLSMDLCCARVSDESIDFMNMHPNNINHCSLYDLIHPDSSETLSRIHRLLLDNSHSNRVPQQQPISFKTSASSDLFLTSSPAQLFQIANGSQTLRETLKFKGSGKSMSCRFYLGGGFGADIFRQETLDHLYMVCIVSELNSITSASNTATQSTTQHEISLQHQPYNSQYSTGNNHFINSLLFNHNESLLNPSDLIAMYNKNDINTSTNQTEAIQLVDHLCKSIISSPTTPPSYDFHGFPSGSSDSSIEGSGLTTPLLDHESTLVSNYNNSGCNRFDPDFLESNRFFDTESALLDSESILMLSQSTGVNSKANNWGYDIQTL